MLTQCPQCQTLFRIKPEQLEVAAGKVRCCQCNSVFNALRQLQESPVADTQEACEYEGEDWRTDATASERQAGTGGFHEEILPFTEATQEGQTTEDLHTEQDTPELSDFVLEKDDGLEPEPDYLAADTEFQMSALLDLNSSPAPLIEALADDEHQDQVEPHDFKPKDSFGKSPEVAPLVSQSFIGSIIKDDHIDTAGERSDYVPTPTLLAADKAAYFPNGESDNELAYDFQPTKDDKKSSGYRLPWFSGSLLLLLLLSGQLAWQWRESLIQHGSGRLLLGGICLIAHCELPVLRDTGKILIQGRNLGTHPNKPKVLFMQLSMINTAAFEQPYPKLQLTFYNDEGELIARRTFMPTEYLPYGMSEHTLMPMARPVLVEMELADPGKEVTGFTFDFL